MGGHRWLHSSSRVVLVPLIPTTSGSGLARQFLHGGQALVNRRRGIALGFEYSAVGLDGGAGEGLGSLLRAQGEEATDSVERREPAPWRS